MVNIPHKTRRLGYAGDPRVPFAWAGWNDALAGRPMDYYLLDRAPPQHVRRPMKQPASASWRCAMPG